MSLATPNGFLRSPFDKLRALNCVLRKVEGRFFTFHAQCGKVTLLTFTGEGLSLCQIWTNI